MRSLAFDRTLTDATALAAAADSDHAVHFYEHEESLYTAVTEFLRAGLIAGEPAIVIATEPHRAAMCASLVAAGIPVDSFVAAGLLILLDAETTLAKFMPRGDDDVPDAESFRSVVGGALAQLARAAPGIRPRAYGEMVDVLWRRGQQRAAIRLEELWNELGQVHEFSLLCAYRMGNFLKRTDDAGFRDVCDVHTHSFTPGVITGAHLESQLQRHAAILQRDRERLAATTEALLLTEAEHRRARADAEQAAAAIARLHRIAMLLSAAQLDSEKIAQTLIDEATGLVHAELGAFFCADDAGGAELVTRFAFPDGAADPAFGQLVIPRDGDQLHRFADQGVVRTDDAASDHRRELFCGERPERMPLCSYLAVPVVTRAGRVVGGLAFGHRESARFTVRHEAKLTAVAALAAAAIDNARLYRAARDAEAAQLRRSNEAAMAARIGEAFTRGGPLGDVLATCCRAVVDHLGAACARIWTADAAGLALELQASAGTPADGADHAHVPLGQLAIGQLAADRRPRVVAGTGEAFAGYPLLIQDRLVGVFAVFAAAPLAGSTLDALAAAADTIAIGIERAHSELERAALLAELTETVRINELFTGVLAHDLRNPLGAIIAAADLLSVRTHDPAHDRPLRSLVNSADRMARMIEQLLDMARLRLGGGFVLEPARGDLRDICQQVVDELAVAHPAWRIAVDTTGDTGGTWDRDGLLQVFSNLAGNAIHHGELSGGLELGLDGSDPAIVVARVANRGAIPPALLPQLFDPFYGTPHKRTGRSRGLGLGLFISKQIVTLHGGTIEVQSVDERTTFTIRLPRRAAAKRAIIV